MQVRVLYISAIIMLVWAYLPAAAQTNYSLRKALKTARSNNPTLKSEQFNINISESDIITARLHPNLNLNNQSLQLMRPSRFAPNTDWANNQNRQVWWQLTKSIQLPNQRKFKYEVAKFNVALAQKSYVEVERNLLQDVALKWLDVWVAQKKLDVLKIAKSNTDSLLSINKIRLKNQVITQTDLMRTELLANQYAIQIKSTEQEYKNEQANLKMLLGVQEEVIIDTTDNFYVAFPVGLESLLDQSLNSRSDILVVKSSLDVANSNIKLQKSLSIAPPELGFIYNPQNSIPYFGVYGTIELPFFSRNQGEIKKSFYLKEKAENDLRVKQVQVQTELTNAYNIYQVQKQNVQNFNGLLTQSESILNNVKYSYLKGGTTIIDFLEAQRSWLETQQQYYDAIQQYRQGYIKLLYSSGLINQMAQ